MPTIQAGMVEPEMVTRKHTGIAVGAAAGTVGAGDVLVVGAQTVDLNGATIVDKVGGGNAERAISAAQGTAAGSVTAVA